MFDEQLAEMIEKIKNKDMEGAAKLLAPVIEKKTAEIISAQFNGPSFSQTNLNTEDNNKD